MKTMNSYQGKYKACAPRDTVERIRGILRGLGIETEEAWFDSGVGKISSVRVTVKGTNTGQNGKGTDRDFACASGYAEFMERLLTGYLLPEQLCFMKGRRLMSREEIKAEGGVLLEETLRQIRQRDGGFAFLPVNADEYLDKWSFDNDEDGKTACIPFRRQDSGRTEFLPENILRAYYFTNGSCAGNSPEEAFVQGMSEICERYAMVRILRERLTPPLIPDCAFAEWPLLKNTIGEIRGTGRYDLRLMDASCGIGLPVVCSALTDRETGKMIIRFGAHPKFEIALERCLTEMLQGRHLETLENVPVYDFRNEESADGFINCFNLLKTGSGTFTSEFLLDRPSWEYRPFEAVPADIGGMLAFMNSLYARLDWPLYIRDCSCRGFFVYQLLVPGVSMVFDFGSKKLTEKRWLASFRKHMDNLPLLPDEELAQIRKTMLLKRAFIIEDTFPFLCGLPVYPELLGIGVDAGILAAMCSIALGDHQQAADLLRPYSFREDRKITRIYPLMQLLEGGNSDKAYQVMKIVCPEGWADEARKILQDPRAALSAVSDKAKRKDQTELLRPAMDVWKGTD